MSYDFKFETQGINTYMVYQLKTQDQLDTLSLGMLTNNKIAGVAPVLFTQLDEKKYIKYNISSKVTVEQFFIGSISKKRLIGVFSSITSALLEADEYMIDMSEFLLDLSYMFVDVTSCEAVLVCLPVEQENKKLELGNFFKNIMFRIQFDQTENCDYVAKIINYLNSTPVFSITEFKKILDEIKSDTETIVPTQVMLTQGLKGVISPHGSQSAAVVQPSNVNIQKSLSGSIQGLSPQGMQQTQAVEEEKAPVKEKKKWFSFGTKNKKDKAPVPSPKKEKKQPAPVAPAGFEVPGASASSPGINVPIVSPTQSAQAPVVKPVQHSASMPEAPKMGQQPAVQQQTLNFGETTVLNSQVGETTVLGGGTTMERDTNPHIVRTRTKEKILLNKEIFRIGKEKSFVDYFIGDNTAISRSHAHFVNRNGEFFIVDTNSTNHTFVNGKMIPSNQEISLSDKATIAFGNEEFKFQLY